jgi:antitoxin (DNA-binding transcriptional repressor) of toxin-antitoxin stability system
MKTLSSVEVQNHFGSIANIVKSGEPVAVTQYGTPTLRFFHTG